ncbi:MAG: hypothetical protein SynsKO_33470 [Synoicihabitans sp.]
MNSRRSLPLLLSLLTLFIVGCGVPYTEIGERGGHKTDPMGNDQFEITYVSNQSGGEPSNRMRELTLLRAAEVALEYGYTHFTVEEEFESVQTKWKMRSTTSPISGGGIGTGGATIGGGSGGISLGGSSGGVGIGGGSGGIGLGTSTGGMGGMGTTGRMGTVTSSSPVPVAIPELSIRIRGYRGVPSTAYKGELYDAARTREILATQYGIKIKDERRPTKQQPVIQVIE